MESGEAATADQLLRLDAAVPTLDGGIVSVAMPWALQKACCLRLSPPLPSFLQPSEASFATLVVTLADESLATLLTMGARAARAKNVFPPPGGTNLGILEDSGPTGETGRASVPNC